MAHSKESLAEHRRELSERIFRQRAELAEAYRGIAKPIQYTQTGIVGLKALQKNAWLIALAPSLISLVFTFFGWKKKGRTGLFGRLSRQEQRQVEREEEKARKPLLRWLGHGWSLFKIYRRLRPFFL